MNFNNDRNSNIIDNKDEDDNIVNSNNRINNIEIVDIEEEYIDIMDEDGVHHRYEIYHQQMEDEEEPHYYEDSDHNGEQHGLVLEGDELLEDMEEDRDHGVYINEEDRVDSEDGDGIYINEEDRVDSENGDGVYINEEDRVDSEDGSEEYYYEEEEDGLEEEEEEEEMGIQYMDDNEDQFEIEEYNDQDESSSDVEEDPDLLIQYYRQLHQDGEPLFINHHISSTYGGAGFIIYHKLVKCKIFISQQLPDDRFLFQLLNCYMSTLNDRDRVATSHVHNYRSPFNLINYITFPEIQKMIENRRLTTKELIPLKLILHIIEHYYRNNDFPLFKTYTKSVLPLMELFYSKINSDKLTLVDKHLQKSLPPSLTFEDIVPIHDKLSQHLNFIKNQLWLKRNLSDGYSFKSFYI